MDRLRLLLDEADLPKSTFSLTSNTPPTPESALPQVSIPSAAMDVTALAPLVSPVNASDSDEDDGGGVALAPGVHDSPNGILDEPTLVDVDFEAGRLSNPDDEFCSIAALSKFPYQHVWNEKKELIADAFWTQGKFWKRKWDVFYVWPSPTVSPKPVFLVRADDVRSFFGEVNRAFPDTVILPRSMTLSFPQHQDLIPRYLGQSSSRDQFKSLEDSVPSRLWRPGGESRPTSSPSKKDLDKFERVVEKVISGGKKKSKTSKKAKGVAIPGALQIQGSRVERVERFLGLRPASDPPGHQSHIVSSDDNPAAALQPVDPALPAQYPFHESVVFVCIDIESYEHDHSVITEIGVSTLDTLHLTGIPPGNAAEEWDKRATKRHFRIREHAHLNNKKFVQGAADRFIWGESEFIRLESAVTTIASCFRFAPLASCQTRKVVLVGHSTKNDVDYMKRMGYDVTNIKDIEIFDTALMFRSLKGSKDNTSLGNTLRELDILPWHLHNAGNDAAYTLRAMMAIALKSASTRAGVAKTINW